MHVQINQVRKLLFAFDAIHALIQRHGLELTDEYNGSGYLGFTHATPNGSWFTWRVFMNEDSAEAFEARLTVDLSVCPPSAGAAVQRTYTAMLSLNYLPADRDWQLAYTIPEQPWQTPQSMAFKDLIGELAEGAIPKDRALLLVEQLVRHFKAVTEEATG